MSQNVIDNNILFSSSSLSGFSYLYKYDQNGNNLWTKRVTGGAIHDLEEKNNTMFHELNLLLIYLINNE